MSLAATQIAGRGNTERLDRRLSFRRTSAYGRVFALCSAVLFSHASAAATPPLPLDMAQQIGIENGAVEPGCVAGLFRKGRMEIWASAGVGSLESSATLDRDSLFYAASLSKQFTALALFQQVHAGRVKLDDTVDRWFPEMAQHAGGVTVRMLLHHTSGLPDYLRLLELNGQGDFASVTRQSAIETLLKNGRPSFAPGSRFAYSNGGYLLLSAIVEKASGQSFADYVREMILRPIGMQNSFVLDGAADDRGKIVHGFARQGAGWQVNDNYPLFGGSGGLVTSLADLEAYDREVDRGGTVWTPQIRRWMLTLGELNDGEPAVFEFPGRYYAGGLMVGPHWFGHGGSAYGFKSLYMRNAERRAGLALLCNRGDVSFDALADRLIAKFDPNLPLVSERIVPPASFEGWYAADGLDAFYRLSKVGEQLHMAIFRDRLGEPTKRVTLSKLPNGQYWGEGVTIALDNDGKGFLLDFPGFRVRFQKVEADQKDAQ